MELDILIETPAWEDALDLEALAQRAAAATCAALSLEAAAFELSLLAADDARIAALNGTFRGKPSPTNVLSWPAEDRAAATAGDTPSLPHAPVDGPPVVLGDIALAFETCRDEAAAAEKPLADHVTHLLVHGLLHCLGYDHETDADATLMETLETRILVSMGVPDPY